MRMSKLKNKSEILIASADLLHKNCYFPAAVHCSYYGCIQLLKHIWLHKMNRTEDELDILRRSANLGVHEFLLNQVVGHIKSLDLKDFRINNEIQQLKKLRIKADYKDEDVDFTDSSKAIYLSQIIIPVLKLYT